MMPNASSWRPHRPPDPNVNWTCSPKQRIVFCKTHKTGSTTTAALLERFGYRRNLSFAMGRNSHIISHTKLFHHSMAFKIPNRTRQDFDFLVNHIRFNRKEMDISVPNAKYISLIRNPITQLESEFGYFEMADKLKIKTKNPFMTFISNPQKYYHMNSNMWFRRRNGQLYDLGLDHKYDENFTVIKDKIQQLSTEIDLMMMNEYYDESMILLKRMMCWDFEDVLYIKLGVRSGSHRYPLTAGAVEKIKVWNAGDVMLYDYFNRTFWQKVRAYGSTFSHDLAHLRTMLRYVSDKCIHSDKKNLKDKRVEQFVLYPNTSKYCTDLIRDDVQYTKLIRNEMIERGRLEFENKNRSLG
ncbi:galactosylceramide sulfotransferase-like [Strongylocentrotus purpuratus]|uniref:Galactosylceramide sulfotransferase n=1 Tax=Strongylocentrotus purpuratus TaxID=7668 RepID=A0A7M7NDV0_STRPU|nr:galactosylceramide sulfotransferase-like [Strongylocentrotus purpuratus]